MTRRLDRVGEQMMPPPDMPVLTTQSNPSTDGPLASSVQAQKANGPPRRAVLFN
jgi:hypothetical protein